MWSFWFQAQIYIQWWGQSDANAFVTLDALISMALLFHFQAYVTVIKFCLRSWQVSWYLSLKQFWKCCLRQKSHGWIQSLLRKLSNLRVCLHAAIVGSLGPAPLGALGLSNLIYFFCTVFFSFLLVVTTPKVANAVAVGDRDQVSWSNLFTLY